MHSTSANPMRMETISQGPAGASATKYSGSTPQKV